MPRLFVDFVGFLISSLIFGYIARKLPRSLVDNAVTSYLDNKIGWLLGLSEPQVDGFLSEYAIPVVLGVVAVVFWHRWASGHLVTASNEQDHSPAPDWGRNLLSRAKVWISHVEPLHIITLGVVIVLGGVIWQWQRAPGSPDSTVTSLKAQIVLLNQELTSAKKSATLASPAPAPSRSEVAATPATGYDAELKSLHEAVIRKEQLQQFLEFINAREPKLQETAKGLARNYLSNAEKSKDWVVARGVGRGRTEYVRITGEIEREYQRLFDKAIDLHTTPDGNPNERVAGDQDAVDDEARWNYLQFYRLNQAVEARIAEIKREQQDAVVLARKKID